MPPRPRPSAEATSDVTRRAVTALVWAERFTFFTIGVLLFAAAIVLLFRSTESLWGLIAHPREDAIRYGSAFLDIVLLVLMVVELAYTVVLSLRGAVLLAEPFLIVGLIAVIRRILVITVNEVNAKAAPGGEHGRTRDLDRRRDRLRRFDRAVARAPRSAADRARDERTQRITPLRARATSSQD
jgi:hypothetical protein